MNNPMMKTRLQTALLLGGALLLSACASLRQSQEIPAPVKEALTKAALPDNALAAVVLPLDARESGLRLQPQRPMSPGSTMKLVTAIVGLDKLGPNWRGRTELLATAAPQGDTLPGPLYLRGGADTDLDWGALAMLLRQLREQGVRQIQGGLVVDRTLFKPARIDIGVPPFDEAPEFQYNVIPDALYLNGVMLGLQLQSDGERLAVARLSPGWAGLEVDASGLNLNDAACKDWDSKGWKIPQLANEGRKLLLLGQYPRNCSQSTEINSLERQAVTAAAVRQLWRELGGEIGPGDVEGATPAGAKVLATHQGRPLAEVIRGMMKRSDNPLTRLVYLSLGAKAAQGEEETRAAAERTVREWFAAKGIATQGLVLENGSGLSRSERISPAQMAALLLAAQDGPWLAELQQSLPIAGYDGTMARRLKGTPAEIRARLKTGTLRDAVGLAGFVPDSQGRVWVVAAMVNDEKAAAKGRPVLDALIDWVSRQ
ncbi:D-alanyl-D-alanine carboxypeptidase/D-alanyl-D-alanine-endopeptidase [Pelomonas sp. SE-A7]|uniref:D-alanyl-D-alanine carboxypeptidase/D-alanyl-D-alanine endopeptidase n=1 Tax=Pelomonas sp. SE-A7 TaxID=3054953 RepID=UPI00259CEB37|nr:D-alanyl-D-alanine carboxypeptidase/D-alanyl-D-alanine-endopeptidase [Pelomonas sp. SE-A7]MDM4768144.1 D-alanyl-D-alanine carboxypeptidase/D-alanyl-D-alanine-endopeptidase [Pelomonas sp. SE-A7]